MKKHEPISKIMSANVASVQVGQPLSDVRDLMLNANIHHVPIIDGSKLVGLISFTDLMKINFVINGVDERSINAIIDQQFSIQEIMSDKLVTIKNTDTIRDGSELLAKGGFHSLPVIDDEGALVGIVTTTDLIRYLNEQY
ncbi:MAG: CBS domain-containing protein [Methylococcaceae bacterium]|nr:CBS domain-containing protein [Methylococcaceae bacterium]